MKLDNDLQERLNKLSEERSKTKQDLLKLEKSHKAKIKKAEVFFKKEKERLGKKLSDFEIKKSKLEEEQAKRNGENINQQ